MVVNYIYIYICDMFTTLNIPFTKLLVKKKSLSQSNIPIIEH